MNIKTLIGKLTGAAASASTGVENITPEAAHSLLQQGHVTIIDIRTPEEYSAGHIPGALNVDFQSASFEVSLRELDKENRYLVHCAAGGRSARSLPLFRKLGFRTVYHLDSGYKGWEKSRLPVER